LDEPARNNDDGKSVRREYGTRDGRLDSAVTRVALTRAISELPEGYRAIFLLHEVEGYQHREIAKLLGCSVGNSKSQLHKAKLRIRDFLTQAAQTQPEIRPAIVSTVSAKERTDRQRADRRGADRQRPEPCNDWQLPVQAPLGSFLELPSSNAA
jgi:hypothetical protein